MSCLPRVLHRISIFVSHIYIGTKPLFRSGEDCCGKTATCNHGFGSREIFTSASGVPIPHPTFKGAPGLSSPESD